MTPYEELGKTQAELLAHGEAIVNSLFFRNEPYNHYVFIVGDELEFAAIAEYVNAHLNGKDIIRHYHRYRNSAGFTVNWKSMNNVYSIVGMHCRSIHYYHQSSLMEFISTTIHEQQHMLTRIERDTGADHRFEDEPRTYSTAWSFDKIMEILRRNWGVHLVSMPAWMIPRARTLDEVCNLMNAKIPNRDIYSGVMQQYMASHTGVVQHDKEGWRAVTYVSGGQDV